jgi:hypothetical protein
VEEKQALSEQKSKDDEGQLDMTLQREKDNTGLSMVKPDSTHSPDKSMLKNDISQPLEVLGDDIIVVKAGNTISSPKGEGGAGFSGENGGERPATSDIPVSPTGA